MAATYWQRMTADAPEVWGCPYLDWVQRDNYNWVNYDFNLATRVSYDIALGYWDWDWYVDLDVNGTNIQNGLHIKGNTSWHQIIRGRIFWLTDFNGKYKGGLRVNRDTSYLSFRATFHDSVGHWGWATYWNVGIPTATAPSSVKLSATNVTNESATLSGSITSKGNYGFINKWRLEYGIKAYNEHTLDINNRDVMSMTWNLDNLESDTTYQYHITVWSTNGWESWSAGKFKTEDDNVVRIIEPDDTYNGRIYIIESDGTVKKVKEIKSIHE